MDGMPGGRDSAVNDIAASSQEPVPKRSPPSPSQDGNLKRLKVAEHAYYEKLYKSAAADANRRYEVPDTTSSLSASQIGASTWSAAEKEILFGALAKVGKQNTTTIANIISTKSRLEVAQYLLLLERGHSEAESLKSIPKLRLSDIPAAIEINSKCSTSLDSAADIAQGWTETTGQDEFAIIDGDLACELDEAFETKRNQNAFLDETESGRDRTCDSDDSERLDEADSLLRGVPSARLLKVSTWLTLSSDIFMNARIIGGDGNWRQLTDDGTEPAICAIALAEFHELIVNLIRRLVDASCFQALSRLRALSGTTSKHGDLTVQKSDVLTALDVMNMKRDPAQIWVGIPRRCGIDVFDDRLSKYSVESTRMLTYDEVEMLLQPLARSPGDSRQPYATSEPDLAPHTQARWKMDDLEGNCSTISSGLHASSNEQKLESSVTDSAYTSSGSTTADSESQDDHSGLTVKPENSEDDNRQEVEDSEDDHRADQLDHQASIEEEQHLMQLFERERNN